MSVHEKAKTLWEREGGHCVSALVDTIGNAVNLEDLSRAEGLHDLAYQAFELRCSVQDYEEAAIQAGWSKGPEGWTCGTRTADDVEEACFIDSLDAYEREVFEHWIVSEWLGRRLAEKGEKVDFDFAGLTVWARTTTGQCVYADHVIEQIALDLYGQD